MSMADSEDQHGGAPACVQREDENGHWHSLYRCSSCLRYQRQWFYPSFLSLPKTVHPSSAIEFDDDDLSDLCCSECTNKKEVSEWNRDWHTVICKLNEKKLVYSRITGTREPAGTAKHVFKCSKCDHDKPKGSFNYAEVERALEERVQPTCAACLPDLPPLIHKLKAAEMKLYLEAWGHPPVKKGTTKKEILNIFRLACKNRIRNNFFTLAKNRDKGLKDGSKGRTMDTCWGGRNY